jgi:hypothetical protein
MRSVTMMKYKSHLLIFVFCTKIIVMSDPQKNYSFISLLKYRFNLDDDKAEESEIIESIKKNIEFKGTNLWTFIFAIFIASIGLNVNSTAVIIGAMLISPLMGPIMGIDLGLGIFDFQLIKKGEEVHLGNCNSYYYPKHSSCLPVCTTGIFQAKNSGFH